MKFERLANPEEVTENADNQTDGESDMESESISGTNATSSSSTHLRSTDHKQDSNWVYVVHTSDSCNQMVTAINMCHAENNQSVVSINGIYQLNEQQPDAGSGNDGIFPEIRPPKPEVPPRQSMHVLQVDSTVH